MLNISLGAVFASGAGGAGDEAGERSAESTVLGRDELLGTDDPSTDDLYLFPEERVLVLLDEHDGRMWQGDVVEATGFSKAKVSRLLTAMEDDGVIARYWKGGKKVVTLPEEGPEPSA